MKSQFQPDFTDNFFTRENKNEWNKHWKRQSLKQYIFTKKFFEPLTLLWNIASSHKTDFNTENNQIKPPKDMKETFLKSFLTVEVISRLLFTVNWFQRANKKNSKFKRPDTQKSCKKVTLNQFLCPAPVNLSQDKISFLLQSDQKILSSNTATENGWEEDWKVRFEWLKLNRKSIPKGWPTNWMMIRRSVPSRRVDSTLSRWASALMTILN
jgi:hypothetical protein